MFCTLKYNEADEPSSLETTSPPFLKTKRNLGKVACLNCRSSKLKCTGEPDGCRRCETRKVSCSYSMAAHPSKSTRRKGIAKGKSMMAERTRHAANVPRDNNVRNQIHDLQYPMFTLAELESLSSLDSWDTLGSFDAPHDVTVGLDSLPNFPNAISGEPFLCMGSPNRLSMTEWPMVGSPEPSLSPYSRAGIHSTVATIENGPQPVASQLVNAKHDHSCFTRAVQIYEMIEVDLVWGPLHCHSEAIGDILEHLKLALAACESLLECQQCTMRHEYVMLLISMCRKITGSLEGVYPGFHAAASRSLHPRSSPSAERSMRQSCLGPLWTPESADSEAVSLTEGSSHGSRSNRSSPHVGPNHGHRSKGWCLDADDEHVIFRSLLRARATRLDAFVTRLDKVVPEEGWPAHRRGTRELQERVKHILSM